MPDKVVVDKLLLATIVISPEVAYGASEYVGPVAAILIAFCTLNLLVSFIIPVSYTHLTLPTSDLV